MSVESKNDEASFSENTSNYISYNGMHWGSIWLNDKSVRGLGKYANGLFFGTEFNKLSFVPWLFSLKINGISTIIPYSDSKTCVNAERICELGVTLDSTYKKNVNGKEYTVEMDGFITKDEIDNSYTRALFATLNSNKLIVMFIILH